MIGGTLEMQFKVRKINMNKNNKLTKKQEIDNATEAGLQLIPYVGGALATLYFGRKQQREFNRIMNFYKEIAEELKNLKEKISLDDQDEEKLTTLIEKVNNKVEKEVLQYKINYFKNYFKNILMYPITEDNDYEEKTFFLDAISSTTLLETEILKTLNQRSESILVKDITIEGVEQYAIVGAVSRLRNLGFLELSTRSIVIGGTADNRLTEGVKVSPFGKKFIKFCLNFEIS